MSYGIHGDGSGRCGFSLLVAVVLIGTGCGPGDAEDLPPAQLQVEPQVLDFGPEEAAKALLLSNTGGQTLSFSIEFAASTRSGVSWLKVQPELGSIEGGSSKSVVVEVVNREAVGPGSYPGELTIGVQGLVSKTIPVTMVVGQPILATEPTQVLDFGPDGVTRNLTIMNAGDGVLSYAVTLPGNWLAADGPLVHKIRSHEPASIVLTVDHSLVPWYGQGVGELTVTSNGLNNATHGGTVNLEVRVQVDPSCELDSQCVKEGHFCDKSLGEGTCTSQKPSGAACSLPDECKSGYCVENLCCESACEAQCASCGVPGLAGTCAPVPDGAPCDDGLFCTDQDACQDGECGSATVRDCSMYDTPCSEGQCDEEAGECIAIAPDSKCVIDGKCVDEGTWHAEVPCLRCLPEQSNTDWTLAEGACLIDGKCYLLGESVGTDCQVCNPAVPTEPSIAPDGTPCAEDLNTCTEDVCQDGTCEHLPKTTGPCDDDNPCTEDDQCVEGVCGGQLYTCNDNEECTTDSCVGDGSCTFEVNDGTCSIDGECFDGNQTLAASHGCSACKPATTKTAWTSGPDGVACDDGDECSLLDHCQAGSCVSEAKNCDDGLPCTLDSCLPESGECANVRDTNWCIIEDKCIPVDMSPTGKDFQCRVCDPYGAPYTWTAYNEGMACDDGVDCSKDSTCQQGACTPVGLLCDDQNPCTNDVCTEDGSCTTEALPDDTPCPEDELQCTADVCIAGDCEHPVSPGSCLVDEICYNNNEFLDNKGCLLCKASAFQEGWTPADDGLPCDDGLYCTLDDLCASGSCEGTPRDCGGDQCNEGWCLEDEAKCVVSPMENGTDCTDESPCTVDDQCESGDCWGVAKDCSDLAGDNLCVIAFCDPNSEPLPGVCKVEPIPDGEDCDDGLFCTTDDTCQQSQCGGVSLVCDSEPCKKAVCDEAMDECAMTPDPAQEGTDCEDGQVCTAGTTCLAGGECGGGYTTTSQECADTLANSNPCMTGICLEPVGCQLIDLPGGTSCLLPQADQAQCTNGECMVVECAAGFDDCNKSQSDGCEADVSDDPDNCGKCGQLCELPHANAGCSDSSCFIVSCVNGRDNCDESETNGCETETQSDVEHCGGCDLACKTGTKYANSEIECAGGECVHLNCMPGFQDDNGDCANGGACNDGCEACEPLADGSVEIPDDGANNDCDGEDSVNDEARGYYVDGSFSFGGGCPAPGLGTRACPFKTVVAALDQCQGGQDWSDLNAVRREVYVAKGAYVQAGLVADLTKPVILVGGYKRTDQGPWSRDWTKNITVLQSESPTAVTTAPDVEGWSVVDGFSVTPEILVAGKVVLRHLSTAGPAFPMDIMTEDTVSAKAIIMESNVYGKIEGKYNKTFDWVIKGCVLTGTISGGAQWTFVDNTFQAGVSKVSHVTAMTGNTVHGYTDMTGPTVMTGNVFHGSVQSPAGEIADNEFGNNLNTGSGCSVTSNTIKGNLVLGNDCVAVGNTIEKSLASLGAQSVFTGNIVLDGIQNAGVDVIVTANLFHGAVAFWSGTVVHNTFYVPPGESGVAFLIRNDKLRVANNIIVWDGDTEDPYYAFGEEHAWCGPAVIRNNALIGFDGPGGAVYLVDGVTPVGSVSELNTLPDLPECGRGGNVAFALADAGFIAVDPESPDFLKPKPDSPLINAGLALPLFCGNETTAGPLTDLSGNWIPCGLTNDMGCYEYCDD